MSLINDALQRAKQSQPATPPPLGSKLQLRPVDPPTTRKGGSPFVWVALFLAVVLAAVLVIYIRSRVVTFVAARNAAITNTNPVSSTPAAMPIPFPAARSPAETPTRPATALPPSQSAGLGPGTTPKPAASTGNPPKLQAIVFNATRPSAIVNNKTVFAGSRVGDFRVACITVDSVTLTNETRTNVLTLE